MGAFATPLQIVTVAAAVTWPFAAGLGVVLWSKARAASQTKRQATLDADLRAMFRQLESRGVPTHLALVVEALEEQHEALTATASRAKATRRSSAPT